MEARMRGWCLWGLRLVFCRFFLFFLAVLGVGVVGRRKRKRKTGREQKMSNEETGYVGNDLLTLWGREWEGVRIMTDPVFPLSLSLFLFPSPLVEFHKKTRFSELVYRTSSMRETMFILDLALRGPV